jgi:ribosome-binding protein aMBF1 (putative translation factor)
MNASKFKTVTRTCTKNRRNHTIPTLNDTNKQSDTNFAPFIIKKNNKEFNTNKSKNNNVSIHHNTSYNKQTANINYAAIERKIDEGTYKMEINYDLINKIKNKREEHNMTQKDLANACNLPLSLIREFEAGKHKLNGFDVAKLLKALDIV